MDIIKIQATKDGNSDELQLEGAVALAVLSCFHEANNATVYKFNNSATSTDP